MNKRPLGIIAITLILSLFLTVPVSAEEPLKIRSMSVSVFPEYDTTDVLVIYDAYFVNESKEPYSGDIVFRVPAEASLAQTCQLTEDGKGDVVHSCQLPSVVEDGPMKIVSWSVGEPLQPGEEYHGYLEYYYDPLGEGRQRSFDFSFVSSSDTGKLNLIFVQPKDSSGFEASMEPDLSQRDNRGLVYHRYNFDDGIAAGDTLEVSFSYERDTREPSVPKEEDNPGRGGSDYSIIVMIILLVGILIAFILYAGRKPPSGKRGSGKPRSKTKSDPGEEKRRARRMLLNGDITEDTYRKIIQDIEREAKH